MSKGLDNLQHIVVLMMENRSFDHMLGGLKKKFPKINGLNGDEGNPDANGNTVKVQPSATYQGQLDHDPDHHFPGVDLQIFGGAPPGPGRVANMRGFIKSYATQPTMSSSPTAAPENYLNTALSNRTTPITRALVAGSYWPTTSTRTTTSWQATEKKRGGQQNIDILIKKSNPSVSVFRPPRNKNETETLYTKLRNDLIHAEERGRNPVAAIAAIEKHVRDFQHDVSKVFSQS